jgi:hypothetical protein
VDKVNFSLQINTFIVLPSCFDTWLTTIGGGIANLSCSAFVSESF